MFVYELSGCGFEFRCCHLNFRYRACFEQRVPWHSGKYFQIVIAKNVSITCIFNQRNLFNGLIPSSLSSAFECSLKKQTFRCLFKIPLWREMNNATFYFLIFLVKIWNENRLSVSIHPGIICFWIWLFGGATYQGEEKAETRSAALISNLCLISQRRYDVDKLKVPGGSRGWYV